MPYGLNLETMAEQIVLDLKADSDGIRLSSVEPIPKSSGGKGEAEAFIYYTLKEYAEQVSSKIELAGEAYNSSVQTAIAGSPVPLGMDTTRVLDPDLSFSGGTAIFVTGEGRFEIDAQFSVIWEEGEVGTDLGVQGWIEETTDGGASWTPVPGSYVNQVVPSQAAASVCHNRIVRDLSEVEETGWRIVAVETTGAGQIGTLTDTVSLTVTGNRI